MDSWYLQDLDGQTSIGGVAAYKRFNPTGPLKDQYEFELVEWKVGDEAAGAEQVVADAVEKAALRAGGQGGESGAGGSEEVEAAYEDMDVEALLVRATDLGLKDVGRSTKRILIEEIEFFDANGRQGVRSRATRKLE